MMRKYWIAFASLIIFTSVYCTCTLCAKTDVETSVQVNISYDPNTAIIGTEKYLNVKTAVEHASDGDVIQLYGNQYLKSPILIDKDISLKATENVKISCYHGGIKGIFHVSAGKVFSLGGKDSKQIALEGSCLYEPYATIENEGTLNIRENVTIENTDYARCKAINGGNVNAYGGEISTKLYGDVCCDNFSVFGDAKVGNVRYNSTFYVSQSANLAINKIEQGSSVSQPPAIWGTLTNKTKLVLSSTNKTSGTKVVKCCEININDVLSKIECDDCELEISGNYLVVAESEEQEETCLITLECEELEITKSYTSWQAFWSELSQESENYNEDEGITFESNDWRITLSGNITVDSTFCFELNANTITIICAKDTRVTTDGSPMFEFSCTFTSYLQIEKNNNVFEIDGTEICTAADVKNCFGCSNSLNISII